MNEEINLSTLRTPPVRRFRQDPRNFQSLLEGRNLIDDSQFQQRVQSLGDVDRVNLAFDLRNSLDQQQRNAQNATQLFYNNPNNIGQSITRSGAQSDIATLERQNEAAALETSAQLNYLLNLQSTGNQLASLADRASLSGRTTGSRSSFGFGEGDDDPIDPTDPSEFTDEELDDVIDQADIDRKKAGFLRRRRDKRYILRLIAQNDPSRFAEASQLNYKKLLEFYNSLNIDPRQGPSQATPAFGPQLINSVDSRIQNAQDPQRNGFIAGNTPSVSENQTVSQPQQQSNSSDDAAEAALNAILN